MADTTQDKKRSELRSGSFWRDLSAEGVATLVLVAVEVFLPLRWGGDGAVAGLRTALGMGMVVTLLIESFGQYGGAHMNPAVTISMLVCRKITLLRACFYIVVQCGFAIAGAALVYFVTPAARRDTLAVTTLSSELTVVQGVLVEACLTFVIVSTVHGANNSARRPVYMSSLPVGCAVTTTTMAGAYHTGASMNCARSFGPAVIMNIWADHWIYWVGPILGGVLAGILHQYWLDRFGKKNTESQCMEHKSHTEDIAMAKLIKSTEDPNGQNCSCYRRRSDETI